MEGGLTITTDGSWDTGITMEKIPPGIIDDGNQTPSWTSNDNLDYISFADDTSTDGFYLTIKVTDFVYSGASQTQADLPSSNFETIANYDGETASPPTIGEDDPTKNVSILPESCESTGVEDFSLHADFSNSAKNYTLTGSTSEITILTGTNTCLALGHLRLDHAEILVPQNSEEGNYTSRITITIYDGAP